MIVYKVDKSTHVEANTQIKDMGSVLSEIAPTLRLLKELLAEHEASITSPSIDNYRDELREMVAEAAQLAHHIAINAQRLSSVSDQASKHLVSLEEQISSALQTRDNQEKGRTKTQSHRGNQVHHGYTMAEV